MRPGEALPVLETLGIVPREKEGERERERERESEREAERDVKIH